MTNLKAVVILLVEDDPGDQKLITKSLMNEKIVNDLHIVNSAEEALEYLKDSRAGSSTAPKPDLIMLDLNMPGIGGREFLKRLKNDDEFDSIPVVILTTSDSERDVLESFKLQAAGYIKKPVTMEGFQAVVHDLSEYWFVVCKRLTNEYKHGENICFVG